MFVGKPWRCLSYRSPESDFLGGELIHQGILLLAGVGSGMNHER